MTALQTDLLAELIQRKHACLTQLRAMGRKQLSIVLEGSMTDLLDVLSAKQRVLADLQRVQRALEPFQGQDPDQRQWESPQRRQQCAEQLGQCEVLLREIVDQEKQSEQELVRRRDEAAAQLQEVHVASHARGAYASRTEYAFRQLDLTSES
jgi:hypothetical protein